METPSYHVNKGDTLDEVEVVKVTKRGVFVEVAPGVLGFVHMSKLLDKEVEKIPANFKMGTLVREYLIGVYLVISYWNSIILCRNYLIRIYPTRPTIYLFLLLTPLFKPY